MQQKWGVPLPNSGVFMLIHDIFMMQSPLRVFLPLQGGGWQGYCRREIKRDDQDDFLDIRRWLNNSDLGSDALALAAPDETNRDAVVL